MDSLPKVLNHVLGLMTICNIFLFLSSWSISYIVFFASLLLNAQTVCVLLVVNNTGRLSFGPRFLSPNEFMVGVCLGISIGGAILALFLSAVFQKTRSLCSSIADDEYMHAELKTFQLCETRRSAIAGVWFWSCALFWLDLIACVLIAAARRDIASLVNYQYQSIGIDEVREIHEEHASRIRNQSSKDETSQVNGSGEQFVGDYGNIPNVHV